MIPKPNAFQKLLHRFVMLRPVSAFFAPWIHRLDLLVLKLTKDRHSAAEILGWSIIQLTTVGAKTNQSRTIPLVGMMEYDKIALVASNFGRQHSPGWHYNLKAHPECLVQRNSRAETYMAREVTGDEYFHYWQLANSYYAGYEKYKQRAAHRHIPIIVLEPKR